MYNICKYKMMDKTYNMKRQLQNDTEVMYFMKLQLTVLIVDFSRYTLRFAQ